jgi:ribose-phosphate pyrophosphokinase
VPTNVHEITDDDRYAMITRAEAKLIARQAVDEALLSLSRAPRPFKIFGLDASRIYAEKVARQLNRTLTPHDETYFEDGEPYVKPTSNVEGNVRGHNVFVIQSLYSDDFVVSNHRLPRVVEDFIRTNDVNGKGSKAIRAFAEHLTALSGETVPDKFMKLCIMCGALRDASAHEITVIIPHLAWARQDRKTESRAPITTKYVAQMLERIGVRRCLFIDVHNLSAEQNAFRIPIDNLETKNLHAKYCADELRKQGSKKVRVLTPDAGGLARCVRFRNALAYLLGADHEEDIEICIFDKVREKGKVVGGRVIGDVEDADVIAYDDMISTGGTMKKACRAAVESGGRLFAVCAAHGLFCGKANEVFSDFDTRLVIADTVTPFRLNEGNQAKIHVIDTTKMVADAVMKIHSGTGSVSELLEVGRL